MIDVVQVNIYIAYVDLQVNAPRSRETLQDFNLALELFGSLRLFALLRTLLPHDLRERVRARARRRRTGVRIRLHARIRGRRRRFWLDGDLTKSGGSFLDVGRRCRILYFRLGASLDLRLRSRRIMTH